MGTPDRHAAARPATARLSGSPALTAALLALSVLAAACGSTAPGAGPRDEAKVVLGPYVGDVGADRFLILWETSSPVPTRLRWGTSKDCSSLVEDAEPATRHEALVRGLRPGIAYWYRLEDGAGTGEPVPVRTRPDPVRSVRVAIVGDTHSTSGVHARIVREIAAEAPDFLLHTGDLSLRRGKHEGGDEKDFFRVEAPLLRSVPVFPVLGNHDGGGSRFVDLFVRPRDAGDEPYYLVRWGPLALVVLDTNQPFDARSDQGLWLAGTLQALDGDPAVLFRIVAMHWGPYDSGSGHGPNAEARYSLEPLFTRHGVDVVFSGHDHVFERSTVNGVRYVMTGGGGGGGSKPHQVLGGPWSEVSSSSPHHGLLEIDGRTLRFTAREAKSGRVLDEFLIEKVPMPRRVLSPSPAGRCESQESRHRWPPGAGFPTTRSPAVP